MEIIIDVLMQAIIWIVILPLVLIFATPVILLINIFRKGAYLNNLKSDYKKIFKYWKDRI